MHKTKIIHYNEDNDCIYDIGNICGGAIPTYNEAHLVISNEAYKPPHERNQILESNGINYEYIPNLSTKRIALYKEPNTNNFIMGHRGTMPTDPKDLESDLYILANQFERTQRFKKAKEQTEKVYDFYDDGEIPINIEHTGHSLGAKVASRVAIKYDSPAVTFNMGTSPLEIASNLADRLKIRRNSDKYLENLHKQTHYTTGFDPISLAANVMVGHKFVKPIYANIHSLRNFF